MANKKKQMITITGWFIYRDIERRGRILNFAFAFAPRASSLSLFFSLFSQEALNFQQSRTADNWRKANNELKVTIVPGCRPA